MSSAALFGFVYQGNFATRLVPWRDLRDMADSGDHIIAYMGPLQLPSGAGYLTTNQRHEIMREFGVTAVVRTRQQWGCSALSLSGPVHQLAAARRRCMEMLQVEQLLDMNRSKAGPERQVLRQRTADMDARSHSMEACMDRPSRRHYSVRLV